MTAALTCYMLLPTGLALRPPMVQGDGLCAQLVRWLYTTDTPTNVCPSIHVFNSVTLALAYRRSQSLCRGKPAVAPGCILRSVHRHLRLHHAAQAAQLH